MSRSVKLAALAAFSAAAFWACSGGSTSNAALSISAAPSTIDDKGEASVITVSASDETGKPGTGSVKITSSAGSLKGDGQTVSFDAKGQATAMFTCAAAGDAKCSGAVKISADWARSGAAAVSTFRNIIVLGSGGGGGSDGGLDAGGGGPGDGGVNTVNTVTLTLQKPTVIVGTGDKTDVSARVTVTATGVAVASTAVTFSTTRGSFEATSGTTSKVVMTDAQGNAKVTLYVAGGLSGIAAITATALDGTGLASLPFVNVASILVHPDPSVKPVLGTQSGGIETTTPVFFKVVDASNNPAKDIAVSFSTGLGSPAGANVTLTGISDAMGIVRTTLQSGDAVGPCAIVATVTATLPDPGSDAGTTVAITATTTITITGGKPSFRGLVVNCARKNMSALTDPAGIFPTRSLKTTCTASLADRFGQPVGLPKAVSWFAERGTINNSVSTALTGVAATTYDTNAAFGPNDTTPLTNPLEPSNGTKNPRDNFITITAVVNGEEEFEDSNGNGKWDPGEWFLDLPEPFVDHNDNQRYDFGEYKSDTQRLNCATGMKEAENNIWDGPNGCWDNNTQLFASTHIAWSGAFDQAPVFNPPPPWNVAPNQILQVDFAWSDAWFNRISADSASISAVVIGNRGTATASSPSLTAEVTGHKIDYEKVNATESAAGSGNFTINGPCNTALPGPTNPLNRCIARYRFTSFGGGNTGVLTLVGPAPQAALPDGGSAPPVPVLIQLSGQNTYFTPALYSFPASFQ